MSDVKISALPAASSVASADLIVIVQGGTTKNATGAMMTALALNGLTISATTGTFTLSNGKTLVVQAGLTLAGTDSTTMTFPAASDTVACLGTVQAFSKAQSGTPHALSVASNLVAVDLSYNNFTLALQATTAQTLSNPTNIVAGQSGQIAITQNGTPSTLAYGTYWTSTDGTTPAVSTTASAVNLLSYYVVDSTHIWFSLATHGVS